MDKKRRVYLLHNGGGTQTTFYSATKKKSGRKRKRREQERIKAKMGLNQCRDHSKKKNSTAMRDAKGLTMGGPESEEKK